LNNNGADCDQAARKVANWKDARERVEQAYFGDYCMQRVKNNNEKLLR
jgi:hypothetical protein